MMRRLAGWRLALMMAVGLGIGDAAADDLIVTATADPAGGVSLEWTGLPGTFGYAVAGSPSLSGGQWRYVASVDQWPMDGTRCTIPAKTVGEYLQVRAVQRGRLVASLGQIDSDTMASIRGKEFLLGVTPTAIYDVTVYGLVYETFDPRGISTLAWGAVAVPAGIAPPATGPLVSYQHGTEFEKDSTPSNADCADHEVGFVLAGDGYIVCMPDYLGLGTGSPGLHPYVHARSEAVCAVDLLRAAKTFLSTYSLPQPNGQLFIAGYSQGGHATMALQRELELHHAAEFPLTASAPMAGPYDLSGTMTEPITQSAEYGGREYVPYLLFSYDAVYDLYDAVSDVLVPPYDTTLPPLFDGAHSGAQVDLAMPRVPRDIFQQAWLSDFTTNAANRLRVALEANDLYRDWTPQSPMWLFHASSDDTVPYSNAVVAQSNFVARGATVMLTDVGNTYTHSTAVYPCALAAKQWFDSFR